MPTIVHNYLPAAKTVNVAMKADGVSPPAGQAAPQPQRLEVAQAGEAQERLAVLGGPRSGTAVVHGDRDDRRGCATPSS